MTLEYKFNRKHISPGNKTPNNYKVESCSLIVQFALKYDYRDMN